MPERRGPGLFRFRSRRNSIREINTGERKQGIPGRETEPLGPPINIALIGQGVSGINQRVALELMRGDFTEGLPAGRRLNLTTVCDLDERIGASLNSDMSFTTDYRKVLHDPEIHAVAVVTPTGIHHKIVMDALEAGKHVYVEKPPGVSVAQCEEMIEKAKEKERTLFFSYHHTYHPLVTTLINDLQKEGKDVWKIYASFLEDTRQFHPNKSNEWIFDPKIAGGGLSLDLGTNPLSIIMNILGETPVSVKKANFPPHPGYDVETKANFEFTWGKSGNKGELHLDWLRDHNVEEDIRLITVRAGDDSYTLDLVGNVLMKNFNILLEMPHGTRSTADKTMEYTRAYDHFARCIINGDIVDTNTFTSFREIQFVEDGYSKGGIDYSQFR